MKINEKILRLVKHGLKATNLTKLNESQIDSLYSRLVEQSTKMIPKSNSAAIQQAKTNKEVFSLYEKENTDSEEVNEKSVSKQQQKLMGLALSVKKGDTPKSKVSKSVKDMAKKMSKSDLEDFASTKH